MKVTNHHIAAEAYAQGRIDAGEPAFMDPDGFTSAATVGSFAFHYANAAVAGHDMVLPTAWAVFMSEAGRTVIDTGHDDTPEDEMPTVSQTQALRDELDTGACMLTRTYVGGSTYRCHLPLGHGEKHTAMGAGRTLTWTTQESDQVLSDRINRVNFVPARQYSTEVATTRVAVTVPGHIASDDQVAADVHASQEV